MQEKWLTTKQAAQKLHVHPETLRSYAAENKLTGVRIKTTAGGHRRFHPKDIENFEFDQLAETAQESPNSYKSAQEIMTEGSVYDYLYGVYKNTEVGHISQWAKDRDLKTLQRKTGVPFAKTYKYHIPLYLHPGCHMSIFSGTRSRKVAGILRPMIIDHQGVAICTGIKDDLFAVYKARQKQGEVFLYDPLFQIPKDITDVTRLSKNDLEKREYLNGENTLFICVSPSENADHLNDITDSINIILKHLLDRPTSFEKPVLMIVDEIGSLGKIDYLTQACSVIGSKRVSLVLSWQDIRQMKKHYSTEYMTIMNNSRVKVLLPGIFDPYLFQYFETVGGYEKIGKLLYLPQKFGNFVFEKLPIRVGAHPLVSAQEIQRIKFGEGICIAANLPPARIKLRLPV